MSETTYRQQGDIINYTPSVAMTAGEIVVEGELVGAAVTDIAANAEGALRIAGVINAPKLSTDVVVIGNILYWDDGNTRMTTTASTHKVIGIAVEDAGSGVADCDVLLAPQKTT